MANEIFVGSVAVGVVPDARGWNRTLQRELVPSSTAVGEEVGRNISGRIVDEMGRSGTKSAGAFSDNFQKRLRAALAKLPKAELKADSTDVDRKVAAIRAEMEALSQKTIGVDMNADAAMAELARLDLALKAVEKEAGSIDVSFNTIGARAQLAMLKHEATTAGEGAGRNLMGGIIGGAGRVGGGGGVPIPGLGSVPAPALAIAGALGLFALPFIGQVTGGLVVSAFGAALAAMPIIGAARNAEVKKTFTEMKDRVLEDFEIIGQSWVPVLESILNTAKQTMDHLTPVFQHAADIIAGPFRLFVNTLIRAFEQPQVAASIDAVAKAFAAILTAIAPDLPGMIATLADAVLRIANAIKDNPKAFANFINFLVQITAATLNAIAFLTRLATFMEGRFKQNIEGMVSAWGASTAALQTAWSNTINFFHERWSGFINYFTLAGHQVEMDWNAVCGNIHGYWSNTVNFLHQAWSGFINFFVTGGHTIESAWNTTCGVIHTAWSNTINTIHGAWSGFINFFVNAGHQIEAAWNTVMGSIAGAAKRTWDFVGNAWNTVLHNVLLPAINFLWQTFSTVFGNIINGAASAFGWVPGIGGKLREAASRFNEFRDNVNASLAGIQNRTVTVTTVMTSANNPYPGGITGRAAYGGLIRMGTGPTADDVPLLASKGEFIQPASTVNHYGLGFMEALRTRKFASGGLTGISSVLPSLANFGKNIWGQISGNVTSAFAGAGGFLRQVIRVILQALPGLLYQAGSAISQAGMGFESGGMVMDDGGWIPPGATTVYNFTGRPEHLTPDGGPGSRGGTEYHAHFDGLTGQAIEGHVRSAFQTMSLQQGNLYRQGRRR
jgi:phage-related protein